MKGVQLHIGVAVWRSGWIPNGPSEEMEELDPDDVQTYDFSKGMRALLVGWTWSIVGKASFSAGCVFSCDRLSSEEVPARSPVLRMDMPKSYRLAGTSDLVVWYPSYAGVLYREGLQPPEWMR